MMSDLFYEIKKRCGFGIAKISKKETPQYKTLKILENAHFRLCVTRPSGRGLCKLRFKITYFVTLFYGLPRPEGRVTAI
jgi:hypothetical protein